MNPNPTLPPGPHPSSGPLPGAGLALGLLLAINLFNYIDRQVLAAVLPKIKLDASICEPDDPWLQTKLLMLTSAFMWSYMLLSPLFGWLGDKLPRWGLVGVAVIAWSLATGATGAATGYLMLLFTRCLVGVGEAAYGPVAPAMLSDLYPVEHRGRTLSWFYMAIPVGSAIGFGLGGAVADTSLGWRGAFHIAMVPGLILGSLCFFMRDPPRREAPKPNADTSHSYLKVLGELRRNRSFVLCSAGMTASTFVLGGVASAIPLYVFEREARFTLDAKAVELTAGVKLSDGRPVVPPEVVDKLRPIAGAEVMNTAEVQAKLKAALTDQEFRQYSATIIEASPAEGSITNGQIGLIFGGILVIGGLLATLSGGLLGDRLRNRGVKGAYFHVSGWGTIAGWPFFVGMLFVPFPYAWGLVFCAVFALFFNTGPANTVLANVTRSSIRATAFAINILLIHALGDAISPTIIGVIADKSSLHTAFLAVSFLIPVAGLLWVAGAPHLDADTQRAES